jgi:hypothetical protein
MQVVWHHLLGRRDNSHGALLRLLYMHQGTFLLLLLPYFRSFLVFYLTRYFSNISSSLKICSLLLFYTVQTGN